MQYHILPVTESEYPEVTAVWEAAVRATHDFLTEADIQFFKPLILNEFLDAVSLSCIKDEKGHILGFAGTADRKLEMLFIDPAARGQGIGKALLQYVIAHQAVDKVDVNEQNDQAVGFYLHNGFKTIARSDVDGMGKPFPLLLMELKK
ncbi:GNAT family N-acetyltransferase [Chitinophaga sp. sic0106]|uniref:GNAT family N-acetyltransferase n=1 Tax=Chitinophaga sp. sic0106 TaxID=2854785 RepID=UPI001C48804C|nr:GNAT family N-acetyltransferase [Chitinophaga sp. sic0106]MBV7532243.1 GNAT family N-acetyltransferase [Chitinophaga sp. sic0106]